MVNQQRKKDTVDDNTELRLLVNPQFLRCLSAMHCLTPLRSRLSSIVRFFTLSTDRNQRRERLSKPAIIEREIAHCCFSNQVVLQLNRYHLACYSGKAKCRLSQAEENMLINGNRLLRYNVI